MASLRFLACLILLFLCWPSRAATANEEVLWFANLIKANVGKTFCAPKTVTVKDLAFVTSKFSDAHPEFHGQLTDARVVQSWVEVYPCTITVTQSQINSAPLAELEKSGVKNIVVAPSGEFALIDTRAAGDIMRKLRATSSHENDALVSQMVASPGNYMPPALFALAELFYRRGEIVDAIFWFNAARLRGSLDAMLCTDISAKSEIQALVQQMPKDLITKQFDDVPQLRNIIERLIKWDEVTPYNYDRRWISLHGLRAVNNSIADKNIPLTVPRNRWDNLAKLRCTVNSGHVRFKQPAPVS